MTPKNLFTTMLHLVSGSGSEGCEHALSCSFSENRFCANETPDKSTLTKARARVSYEFFEQEWKKLNGKILEAKQSTWRGLRLFAQDGFNLDIPRTESLLKQDYRGYFLKDEKETYRLKMHTTHCIDVLSGVIQSFRYSPTLNEQADAREMLAECPVKGLYMYDRLYYSKKLVAAHKVHGSFFLARVKRDACREVKEFGASKKQQGSFEKEGVRLYMVKVKLRGSDRKNIFVTNLPKNFIDSKTIERLYMLRWEVEVYFRDLIQTVHLEQWHSKSYNGIQQEIYAALYLYNYTKAEMHLRLRLPSKVLEEEYTKCNFKNCFNFVRLKIPEILERFRGVLKGFTERMLLGVEKRKRRKAQYPRVLKRSSPKFPFKNTIPYKDNIRGQVA